MSVDFHISIFGFTSIKPEPLKIRLSAEFVVELVKQCFVFRFLITSGVNQFVPAVLNFPECILQFLIQLFLLTDITAVTNVLSLLP